MNLIQYSFLMYIFLKQFYFFSSGGLQPADLFLIVSVFLYIGKLIKGERLLIKRIDINIVIFVFSVVLINLIYLCIYIKFEFLLSLFHYIFILGVIFIFRIMATNNLFFIRLLKVLKTILWCQLLIYFTGLGDYYMSERYMGTFNDPNQLAFFVYAALMLIHIISLYLNKKISIIYYLITLYIIFISASTGMLLAITIYSVIWIVFSINFKKFFKKKSINKILRFFAILSLIMIFIVPNIEILSKEFNDLPIFSRLEEKIGDRGTKISNFDDRGYDKLLLYPEKMIYGAGQGYYARFNKAAHGGEIHSTLPSILFSYGIIPTIFFVRWIVNCLNKIPFNVWCIYLSLIIESFTLLNQRQPFFWILFLMGNIYINKLFLSKKGDCDDGFN